MPAASSIYWNSVDSQRSSSGGSSGDARSSSSRHYVDPWDLENYDYLRRHSIATSTYHPQCSTANEHPPYPPGRRPAAEPEYWYPPAIKEPGYHAPASVEELYLGPPRHQHHGNSCYYHQPIYEDELQHYAAPVPVYAPLSDLEQSEPIEDHRLKEMLKRRAKLTRARGHRSEDCLYHGVSSKRLQNSVEEVPQEMLRGDPGYVEMVLPAALELNTYGHLKIDYTNSWNSLHRKIRK